jgi:hypothetical protein
MRYYKVEFGNGFCGCDEEFVYQQDISIIDNFLDFVMAYYTYAEGAAGIDIGTEEEVEAGEADLTDDEYIENILEYSFVEEITKEQYDELVEDGWEER